MPDCNFVELFLSGGTAIGTLGLAAVAFYEIRRSGRERLADTIALRYLLFSELSRLTKPYRQLLEKWQGEGYQESPPGVCFEGTSEALRQALAQMRILPSDERRAVGLFAHSIGLLQRHSNQDRFDAREKVALSRFVQEAEAAIRLVEKRLPQYAVSTESTGVWESQGTGA